MDTNTSGEDFLTKARKPYTITKQRERWSEDEHDRFLEALKLYGRAWQRIEEHIGTKTAVQIRSHAQKFFTKLEKEAEAKGIPVNQALDIEIPPPRPKRKPNTPYPRKPGNNNVAASSSSAKKDAKHTSSASSSLCNLDLEKTPLSEKTSNGKENQDDNCSGVSTVNKSSLPKKVTEPSLRKANDDNNMVQDVHENNKDSAKNYPWPFPADFVNGNIAKCSQFVHPTGMISPQDFMFRPMGDHHRVHAQATSASTTTTTTTSTSPQDDYGSFHQISSTFSNLIMSTLLQNPAAHAAATYAASVWPYPASSADSSPPSIAAIAAATVAAATAWWASHGLLLPPPTPVTCLPLQTVSIPTPMMMAETGKEKESNEMDTDETEKQDTALQDQKSKSKSPSSSFDDSEETGVTKLNTDSKTENGGDKVEMEEEEVVAIENDSNIDTQNKKKLVDRSSCGSNTPSGSDDAEEETDALDHKMEKDDKEDVKETDVMELSNRRSGKLRENNNNNNSNNNNQTTDSWKEVSEEGRIAFQALFARERLPQSFSPPLEADNMNKSTIPMAPNFNNKIQDSSSCDAAIDQERVVMIGGKNLKTRQTGFKPYKRCSMEAKESQVGNGNTNNLQSDEKVCKRLRLEAGEASTTT